MITKMISAFTEPAEGLLEPARKLNQQAVTAIGKVAAYQIDSLQTYSRLGVGQLQAAAEVKNIEDIQHLLSKQNEVLKEVGGRLMSDCKAFYQIGADFVSQSSKVKAQAPDAGAPQSA